MLKLVPIWEFSVFPGEDCGEDSLWFLLPTRRLPHKMKWDETMRPLNTALLHWNGPICITRANIYIIHQYTPTNQYTSYTLPPTNPRTNIHYTPTDQYTSHRPIYIIHPPTESVLRIHSSNQYTPTPINTPRTMLCSTALSPTRLNTTLQNWKSMSCTSLCSEHCHRLALTLTG